ncbi:MAG: SAM-dependent DNA methyltransferase [Candidatus Moeniiplasma glomeromycotorum]|nr:SAM-dependent DNA methyltransferase [Candidatus Moeniiplasma glomeromycotorum]MCE8167976.1 SAM-dependent DNA methyltransferase [Candidatus Moeniiplasma glomeromycotorum]MCE8169189.1 SAM-dependent DNA methyltransferase [Candidatus Moeniiplasma glomeromycotorum]
MNNKFYQSKQEFDEKYASPQEKKLEAFIPVDLQRTGKVCSIKGKDGKPNEEYYKWQFFYSLIREDFHPKKYIGCEIRFPKGNKNSAPIKLDGAIFDDPNWFDHYEKFCNNKDWESLDWLRKHLIGVIEFKNENSKNIETVYNQQLKPAMRESEKSFCLGVIYDAERLYLFQRRNGNFLRFDWSYNLKGEKSTTKDLCLHLTDTYKKFPSFEQLEKQVERIKIDRSKRTIDNLDIITGTHSKQLGDGVSQILRVMDKVGLRSQKGYEILIQILALKIFDEKRSQKAIPKKFLEWYMDELETDKLLFYITKEEKTFNKKHLIDLNDEVVQGFITRIRNIFKAAKEIYHHILKRKDTEVINWENSSHIRIISEVVEWFQDYSFVNSHKTDLYQIVFYKFASEFSKAEKGQFITPIPLIDFLVKIVNPRSDEKIIDPTAGIADFLSVSYVNSESKLDDKNIYGLDNDEHMVMLAQLNMLLNGDGNACLECKPDKGSIIWKFDNRGELVDLKPNLHKKGNWDNWKNQTELKKFDVVLTNPPFGEDRKYEPKNAQDKEIIEMYELWHVARCGNWIDLGLIFLENAYRILKENGRIGIVLSNSIASIDRWKKAREWLMSKMRIVALFDLPPNVFADSGVNTTLVVAYKPENKELERLQKENYNIFTKSIKRVGYEIRTSKRIKFFNWLYKINEQSFEIEQDKEGEQLLDEEFSETIKEFRKWCNWQEEKIKELFVKKK